MSILTSEDFDQVRAALDPDSVGSGQPPDAVIGLDLFLGAAEAEVQRRDPDWATRTGEAGRHLRVATALLVAERLALGRRDISSEQLGDVRVQYATVDRTTLAAGLRREAERELSAALGSSTTSSAVVPLLFTTAAGGRGI